MKTDTQENNTTEASVIGNLAFVKEVAKYFMDFLETDFHKRKNPKRSVKYRTNDNLLVGINLSKYPSFTKEIWKLITHGFNKSLLSTISKGVYRSDLPKNLLDLITLQVGKIQNSQINELINAITDDLEKSVALYSKEYDKALSVTLEAASLHIKTFLVLPFVGSIEKSIENLGIGDENDIFLMEEELTEIFLNLIENKVSELLKVLVSKQKINIQKELKSVIDLGDTKNTITSFFESFQVGDLFSELFEIDKNRAILDKQEFYLYFCDISFNKVKYPIFYTPFSLRRDNDVFYIEFDSQIYINKKAIEFIVQEYNKETGTKGSLKSITERIIYLSKETDNANSILEKILNEITNLFGLNKNIDLDSKDHQQAKSLNVRTSNSVYLSLFDKSDEALVNDYEEILQQLSSGDGELAEIFNTLVDDFIHKNPISVSPEVTKEWDDTSTPDRLVSESPIPLNSEQIQILSAIKKEGCKYITVEGPPGTGKSHTITAIIFDAILKNQSVLVLSDKKEALDVVEDKITETMNRVRRLDDGEVFQNPILRLGKTGNTYGQILAKSSIEKIKTHHHAVQKDYLAIEENILKISNSLKEDIEAETLAYSSIDLQEINEFCGLEEFYSSKEYDFDIDELSENENAVIFFDDLRSLLLSLPDIIKNDSLSRILNLELKALKSMDMFFEILSILTAFYQITQDVSLRFNHDFKALSHFKVFSHKDLGELKKWSRFYEEAKMPIFGYLFRGSKLQVLNNSFKELFPLADFQNPHENINDIKRVVEICDYYNALKDQTKTISHLEVDHISVLSQLISTGNDFTENKEKISSVEKDFLSLVPEFDSYPNSIEKLKISKGNFSDMLNSRLVTMTSLDFDKATRYAILKNSLVSKFGAIPTLSYVGQKKELETLVTTQVTHVLDSRLINFYNNNKADAETLREVIKNKMKFPKEQFLKLKEAFPCILAGIRDYAEYIPLHAGLFDLVIIDEASQVSIAQAFPALIRAKKVLILGDRKQFSNIKAAQARSETNREYLNSLAQVFRDQVSEEDSKMVKLGKFDIKTSILEFFEFITNYNTQLLKHFRGYKEIISYSNKYFYQDSLQVMKIRGKKIDDVIKFSFVDYDGKDEPVANSNRAEIDFIIKQLKILHENNITQSVGIITPHTNQQKLLMEAISKLPERDFYFENLKLKIMTFDTCQGEERDIIYYSMVASENSDRLWGVFIKDFNSIDSEEDGKIKVQRLNVGFSRAKETIHFVLSKSLDKFNGSIGDALRHYNFILEEAKKEHEVSEVDQNSKMEPRVLKWFYDTDFWKNNKESIEFFPQFEIGKYLKQLDRTYKHPHYKVDFLLVYKDENQNEHKIIIEYDGFTEHFSDIDQVNEFNYADYYSEDDVYRQKVLESYGYKFLRINKFNIGSNPVITLNERITSLLKNYRSSNNSVLNGIQNTIQGLQNGEKKECPKCHEIRDLVDFKDPTLIRGYGRFCKPCKSLSRNYRDNKPAPILSDKDCPRCGSKMILRKGKRGQFYGCSKFPYCRGTKSV
ncbi:MAG: AAA domain-containing protein [Candidatus Paceibacterota bacterium]